MKRLEGKVAIVTGAARGTGAATARRFVAEGARVVATDVLEEAGRAVADELGESARFERLDVRSPEEWERAVAAAEAAFGRVDVLVNNAAVLLMKSIVDTEPEEFDRVVAVNQKGTWLGIRAVAAPMQRAGGGSIVNIASIDALRGQNGLVAYVSSKWAVRGITRVAALELGRHGIRVNAVCPEAGSVDMVRPYLPEGIDEEKVMAMQQPLLAPQAKRSVADRIDDVAKLVVFLASDESASCTGADFPVDGGNSAGKLRRGLPGS